MGPAGVRRGYPSVCPPALPLGKEYASPLLASVTTLQSKGHLSLFTPHGVAQMILYGLVIGLLAGWLFGGRLALLADIGLRWGWVGLAAIAFQVVLFSTPIGGAIGWLAPAAYVASTGAVLLAVLANLRLTGMPLVAAGAVLNFAAVMANGGYMPSTSAALELAGRLPDAGYSNSAILAHPLLAPLTDLMAVPRWVPLSNVFSAGDVLIAAGIGLVAFTAMRRPIREPNAT
jgi:hypothetical protein